MSSTFSNYSQIIHALIFRHPNNFFRSPPSFFKNRTLPSCLFVKSIVLQTCAPAIFIPFPALPFCQLYSMKTILFFSSSFATIKLYPPGLDLFPPGFYYSKELFIKTIAYIDGQNFLYKVAERLIDANLIADKQEITKIDIPFLIKQHFPNQEIEIRYYSITKIRQQTNYGDEIYRKSVLFADNLRRLRNCLAQTGVIFRPAGTLKIRCSDTCKKCGTTDYKFQEKGVDVGLAVDIVADALNNQVDRIVIVSSDTDLIPALRIVKNSHKQITYVHFENQSTHAISHLANDTKIIQNSDVIEAYLRIFN